MRFTSWSSITRREVSSFTIAITSVLLGALVVTEAPGSIHDFSIFVEGPHETSDVRITSDKIKFLIIKVFLVLIKMQLMQNNFS